MEHQFNWESDSSIIFKILEKARESAEEVLVWQKLDNDERIVAKGKILKCDLDNKRFLIRFFEKTAESFFHDGMFYVRCETRSLLFKAKYLSQSHNEFSFLVSNSAKVKENRLDARFPIISEDSFKVLFEKEDQDIIGKTRFEFLAKNISPDGLGLLFSVSKLKSFTVGERILLKSLGTNDLDIPLPCEIKHLSPVKQDNDKVTVKEYMMGLKFLGEIPNKAFELIIQNLK